MKKFCENCGRCLDAQANGENINNNSCNDLNCIHSQNAQTGDNAEHIEPYTPAMPTLKVVKGDLFNTIKRITRTQDLLNFSQSILWPERNFSENKKLQLQSLIAEHFRDSKDIDQTFRELVERTVMAKRWVDEKEYRFILKAEQWFDINRIDGLYFTHGMYGRMLTQRRTIPSYEFGLTVISEAVLRYCEKKNVLDIYNYREQFIKLNRMDLLQYYFNAVMHIQFINL